MGNCSLMGVTDTAKGFNFIRIMTDSGEILKLKGPKLVGEVLNDFPGYRIFRQSRASSPLFDHEELLAGKFYYLLPHGEQKPAKDNENPSDLHADDANEKEPVRMSSAALDLVTSLANGPALEVLPPPQKGVWRVKLAISPSQLEEILAEEANTEALIEKMRMAASSVGATPRKTKTSWGIIWKPILANVLKVPIEQQDEEKSDDFSSSSPAKAEKSVDFSTSSPAKAISTS